jgi:phosphoenolpyruvate carboxylase
MRKIKSFIFAIGLSITLLVIGIFYNIKLEEVSSRLCETVNNITASLHNEDFISASKNTKKLENEIKKLEVFFASTGNHQEIDNIEMSLAELKRYIEGEQKYDALAKSQVLDFLFHHLPKNSRLRIENIF